MVTQKKIEEKLSAAFNVKHMSLVNESHMHAVPPGSESHFQLILVSSDFSGLSLVARQRRVNEVLKEELAGVIHALSQKILTPKEWEQQKNRAMVSPKCLGDGG